MTSPRSPVLGLLLLIAVSSPSRATTPAEAPVLRLSGNDFPTLAVHLPTGEAQAAPGARCAQVRGKRVDELDPLWKQAIERIHFDCEELDAELDGIDMVATTATGFLRPATAAFAGVPVSEVRMMDSELWGDHQYILDRPYAEIREALKVFLAARCQAQQDQAGALATSDCALLETADGLYLETGAAAGVWLHPQHDDPRRTVYAEAWSD
jgi:hypothetical protein